MRAHPAAGETAARDHNDEQDLAGYRVYYQREPAGLFYLGTGADQGNAPVEVGAALSATLTGLTPGIYQLAVTAYDNDLVGIYDPNQTTGHESWYATPVSATLPLPGDVDGNWVVDVADIQAVAEAWHSEPVPPAFDLDGNGVVSVRDVLLAAAHFGTGTTAGSAQ